MSFEPSEPLHQPPLEVAPNTFVIRCVQPAFGAPLSVSLNSLVIRAAEPVILDTGTRANRRRWLEDTFSLVEPEDVRWIVISHEDHDHTGNLAQVLELCPNATLVGTWAMSERIENAISVPPNRLRWVHDGETLHVGDRELKAVRPPLYDCPTTRGFLDSRTGVYWASDCFATPMTSEPVDDVRELPPPLWDDGLAMFHHHALTPWLTIVDRDAYRAEVERLRRLAPSTIASAHSPVIAGEMVDVALDKLAALPDVTPPPHPDQAALEAALAGVTPA